MLENIFYWKLRIEWIRNRKFSVFSSNFLILFTAISIGQFLALPLLFWPFLHHKFQSNTTKEYLNEKELECFSSFSRIRSRLLICSIKGMKALLKLDTCSCDSFTHGLEFNKSHSQRKKEYRISSSKFILLRSICKHITIHSHHFRMTISAGVLRSL